MSVLHLEIMTPDRVAFEGDVSSVYLEGSEGRLGILPAHTPLIATLSFGKLRFDQTGKPREFLCGEGFLEISENRASVLVDSAEDKDDIDQDRAERALERARSRINSKEADIDLTRAEAALRRAMARLKFVKGE
ncbi:MAG: F0F1 ATP synthase subunit epsilon [Acidobacteria bacterium]|nr:F0F1 ATP synthase subunit epsilon [Acidobacteriota bacterium]